MSIHVVSTGPLVAAGCILALALTWFTYLCLTDEDDAPPKTPRRRHPRARARGTRARRHALLGSACRRVRAIRAWAASWFWWWDSGPRPWQALRERIALRARGITTGVTGDAPSDLPGGSTGELWQGNLSAPARQPTRLATGAERRQAGLPAPWYAPELAPRAELSPWEHQTQWFSLDAIDDDIRAREAAAAGGDT